MYENSLLDDHKIMLNPRAMGTVTRVAEKGAYTVDVSFRTSTPYRTHRARAKFLTCTCVSLIS